MSDFDTIETQELKEKLDRDEVRHFWNVLKETETLIPGSRHVPLDRVAREARSLDIDESEEIIVYCANPECSASPTAAEKLADLGFENVLDYEGGLEGWKEAGYELEEAGERETAGATA